MSLVLVACEFSGIVRDAFRARGHDAWSCDLLATERPGPHIQDDVLRHLEDGWDLVIGHPPCTHLCVSGARWFAEKQREQDEAVAFFMALADAPICRIAIENPIGIMSTRYRRPDQIVQPWMFGHGETKATCFWLRGLPRLIPTLLRADLFAADEPMERKPVCHFASPGPDRWKIRSRTCQGIADAMAEQWGGVAERAVA